MGRRPGPGQGGMSDHPRAARLRFLMARARRGGYQLIAYPAGGGWALVDIYDGERLFECASLSDVERFLRE
ncbi:hypothetical protein NFA_50090 [Nocardia farcinica IFM 10152]|uniref:Uncharacterized protein n=2 Tax=Nocardia farcinica TaxID=37329 RepID=Q5YPN0_NOCFA|nr:hypothetical protein NFA_50090 [Nocardia farcinica IFM 10152]